ncbi:copper oxidase [Rhizobium sp. Root73]|uniref:multicopper oxidase family protein n=1 Tax=unclassified Rhizobium TaxID=2613769 RepID=UPI000729CAFB|nr:MULTISPECIES: multicopper oxidase family protein [unclassified Rhizobium]KQY15004.1 copper oxidase [Rhizobium sp. Root1334]KRC06438.1 copper oxidase [Rhizobium sp. Root73]
MHRRTFLTGLAGLVVAGPAAAQMKHDMGGMSGHGNHTMPMTGANPVLPEGQPLKVLPRLSNQSAAPGMFKAELAAEPGFVRFAEGLDTPVLLYNGANPVIEAFEGDKVEVSFRNGIPGEPTTIHWHGMPVPADQDGNPSDPVAAGSERIYAFDLPQGSAASYWFHPHPHGLTAEQVYRGLAGIFIVKPKSDPIPPEYGDTVLMLTDLRIGADGTMPESTMIDLMNGRVGDHVLVNGQKNPAMTFALGEKRRLRLFNATNARFLRLRFENASMTVIGTDGGLIESPVAVEELLLTPAERVEVIVSFDKPGAARLTTLDYERGWMGPGKPNEAGMVLLTANVSEQAVAAIPPLPAKLRSIEPLGKPAVTRRFVLTESMGGMDHGGMPMQGMDHANMSMSSGGMEMKFLINGASFDMNRIDEVSKAGQVELWEIVNEADMDHPFHVHGTQFQIVEHEKDGKVTTPPYRAWKDTVNIVAGETVRILLRQDMPGPRMYHCHILEHEQLGMMGTIDVRA